jgi:zinc transporter ZupT
LPHSSGMTQPAIATAVGLAGAVLGLRLTGLRSRTRVAIPFSAGVLLGVAVFGLLPELGSELGWLLGGALFAAGYVLLLLINRHVYRVCPTCSHDHDHDACSTELHGFAAPLIAAAAVHSFLDGWSIATAQMTSRWIGIAVPLAIAVHKAPEGIALGGILRAAMPSGARAFLWCALAEGTTLAGGAFAIALMPHFSAQWIAYPLGIAAGWLAYLGYHAIHQEWRKGAGLRPALTGMAFAAVLLRGVEAIFR